jgi:hypothetical protein
MNRREWCWVVLVTLALVVASSLPYLVAWAVTPERAHFTGLLVNPLDGHSYIAKMRQGLAGSWSFHLPYTPEPHVGAHIYLFYLLPGHLARWTGLPLIVVYHGIRVAGGAAMLSACYVLASRLGDDVGERRIMFLLTALGSGLGWLAGLFNIMTADLWVPEAFPAYALLANAHFPIALGLMVVIAICGLQVVDGVAQEAGSQRQQAGERGQEAKNQQDRKRMWGLGMVLAAVVLGVIQPFGLVTTFGGLGAMLVARAMREREIPWHAVTWVVGAGAVALPYPLYTQWALRSDPVLAVWNAQNVTPSPPLWNWALSYGLVLVLAGLGCVAALRRRADGDWLLLGWAMVTLVGMSLPLPLQRRLSLGLGVPMGLLAGIGWRRVVWPRVRVRKREVLQELVVAFCALTPLFLVLVTLIAALAGEPRFYLSEGEWAALEWLRDEGQPDAVVLCAPQMGLFVPAWAGQRVVYGHPFETLHAKEREQQVTAFWAGEMTDTERADFLRANRVGYVLVGPRELQIAGCKLQITDCRLQIAESVEGPVFEAGDVRVYQLR